MEKIIFYWRIYVLNKKIALLLLCCTIPFFTACSKAIDILLQDEEDVTMTTTLTEEPNETNTDIKIPESKALSASFSPTDLFSTTLFKDDPALLQFAKKWRSRLLNLKSTLRFLIQGS